ncbi:hypothetical protein C8R46DRAFT_1105324 [Mycena filopes]|nr:hypothetical protein C8R46DRAFT_1144863 [Mycena filopes]KAJ7161727.1 hypothetical protein C8R46DRAFT_1105324 [Mycena filopes]
MGDPGRRVCILWCVIVFSLPVSSICFPIESVTLPHSNLCYYPAWLPQVLHYDLRRCSQLRILSGSPGVLAVDIR